MKFQFSLLAASAIFAASFSVSQAQQKDCTSSYNKLSLGYDGAVGEMNVKSGKACRMAFGSNNFIPDKIEVVTQPRFGKIVVHSLNTWSYVPRAGYAGADEFKIRYVGKLNDFLTGQRGATVGTGVSYNVTVVR